MRRLALLLALPLLLSAAPPRETAIFAGGCFWCMEAPFDKLPGVIAVTSGYTGGPVRSPSYEQVSSGGTGHRESVEIVFDPTKISYAKLLDVFWHNIDPLDNSGQFCDKGQQYRSAIYYHDATQQKLAQDSKTVVEKKLGRVATDILPASNFWPAEEYHQHYYRKNPVRYRFYRFNCGRDQRLNAVWGSAAAH
ncbi:MAG: peptide-methionine (S)-S-oxide reductase MsrA [Acidobacteriota bacterium]|nr:peptide-methionine (S)-S-oxide reductase MsrA [Acidobacteriota bacterium]